MINRGTTKAINQSLVGSANDSISAKKESKFDDTIVHIPICVGYSEALANEALNKTIRYYESHDHVKEICIYLSPYTDPFSKPDELQATREDAMNRWIGNQEVLVYKDKKISISDKWKNRKVTFLLQDDLAQNKFYKNVKVAVEDLIKTDSTIYKQALVNVDDFLNRKIQKCKVDEATKPNQETPYELLKKNAMDHLIQEIAYFCYCTLTEPEQKQDETIIPPRSFERVLVHYNNKLYSSMLESAIKLDKLGTFSKKAVVVHAQQVKRQNSNKLGEYKFDHLLGTEERCHLKQSDAKDDNAFIPDESQAEFGKKAAEFYQALPVNLRDHNAAIFFADAYSRYNQRKVLSLAVPVELPCSKNINSLTPSDLSSSCGL